MATKRLRVLLGHRVRELRRRRGLSLEALGERAKLDSKYLQSVEVARQSPTLDTIEKIAAGLGIQPAELFVFTEESASATRARISNSLKIAADEDLRKIAKLIEVLIG